MGIKGIYKEIGPGKRISLCKLAVEKLEQSGQPFRLAIDISIWQFQVQAAKGGANPAIRTLFYRLVRLLGLPIQPIFVFDGPNKPVFKRNKRSGRGDGVATAMAKRLIRLFGFQVHDAPGEAEAECALLQQHGIVDAVLSEDVDTIMFGCTRTLRNWSADGVKGSKAPTHVTMYDSAGLRQGESGLDREGMVLVALMSGGDYLPEGVPGCGVKVACQAANGGFGKSLCRLKKSDTQALVEWRDELLHELRTNQSGFFRTRHRALTIPDSFPNLDILRYYTHPVVSQMATLERLKDKFPSTTPVDVVGLREFVRETFDWTYRIGAVKFIRVLAPSLVVQKMLSLSRREETVADDADRVQETESTIVNGISNRRTHLSTDSTPELRISFTPATVVGINLDDEPEEVLASYGRDGLALNSDDEFEEQIEGEEIPKNGARKAFDPLQPDAVWIPESIAKLGVPLTVEDWEEKQRTKELSRLAKTPKRRAAKKADMPIRALDRYLKATKNTATVSLSQTATSPSKQGLPSSPMARESRTQQLLSASTKPSKPALVVFRSKPSTKQKGNAAAASNLALQANPWTLASSQDSSPNATKSKFIAANSSQTTAIIISSSPVGPPSSPPRSFVKHVQTLPLEKSFEEDPFASPTGSPRRQRSPGLKERKEKLSQDVRPGRTRPKEQAAKKVPEGTQMSIKSFGRLTEAGKGLAIENGSKTGQVKGSQEPVEILSDDETSPAQPSTGHTVAPGDGQASGPLIEKAAGRLNVAPEEEGIVATTVAKSKTTKIYIPRTSNFGYFKEVEVTWEEAERLTKSTESGTRAKGAAWRYSEVSVVDLTGDT